MLTALETYLAWTVFSPSVDIPDPYDFENGGLTEWDFTTDPDILCASIYCNYGGNILTIYA